MGPWVLPKLNSLAKEHPPGARVTVRGKVSWKRPGERPSACVCDVAAQESLACWLAVPFPGVTASIQQGLLGVRCLGQSNAAPGPCMAGSGVAAHCFKPVDRFMRR